MIMVLFSYFLKDFKFLALSYLMDVFFVNTFKDFMHTFFAFEFDLLILSLQIKNMFFLCLKV